MLQFTNKQVRHFFFVVKVDYQDDKFSCSVLLYLRQILVRHIHLQFEHNQAPDGRRTGKLPLLYIEQVSDIYARR